MINPRAHRRLCQFSDHNVHVHASDIDRQTNFHHQLRTVASAYFTFLRLSFVVLISGLTQICRNYTLCRVLFLFSVSIISIKHKGVPLYAGTETVVDTRCEVSFHCFRGIFFTVRWPKCAQLRRKIVSTSTSHRRLNFYWYICKIVYSRRIDVSRELVSLKLT